MTRYILLFLFSLLVNFSFAQDHYFREYLTTPILVNPAFMAMDNDATLNINYRNQNIGPENKFQTSQMAFKYPILGRNNIRRGAVGLALLDDRAGDHTFLKLQAVIPSLAYNLNFQQNHYLSFALNAAFYRQSLDQDLLTTGMQYIPERGFVSNLPSGENFTSDFLNYTGIDFGMLWYYQEQHFTDAWMGFSVININRPGISLLSDNTLNAPVRFNLNGGVNLLKHKNAALITDFLLSHQDGRTSLFYGGKLKYFLASESGNKVLSAGIHHAWGKSAVFSAGLSQQHFSFVFNYELDMGNRVNETPFYNATEYALVLKKTISTGSKKSKKRAEKLNNIPAKPIQRKTTIQLSLEEVPADTFQISSEIVAKEMKEPVTSEAAEKNEKVADRKTANIVGDKKTLQFDFNSSKVKQESHQLLEQIVKTMQNDKDLNIMLVGHTDNVGSEAANLVVSRERAASVAEYLVQNGIEKSRIKVTGKGELQPLNDNSTPEKQAKNRRVEFIIF